MINELEQKRQLMHETLDELFAKAQEAAEAEAVYQAAKAARALELKAQGVPVTLIEMTIKGDSKVNNRLMRRDCALAEYKATQEALNVYKLDCRLLEAQISRDWSAASEY